MLNQLRGKLRRKRERVYKHDEVRGPVGFLVYAESERTGREREREERKRAQASIIPNLPNCRS